MRNPLLPRLIRRHRWDPRRPLPQNPAPPTPTVNVVRVAADEGSEFNWIIRWEFSDDIPTDLTLADVAGLRVDSGGPSSVEDADANWIVLRYHTDQGPGAPWLVAPGGSPLFVPGQTGTVGEL